jgi:hypothetical protein
MKLGKEKLKYLHQKIDIYKNIPNKDLDEYYNSIGKSITLTMHRVLKKKKTESFVNKRLNTNNNIKSIFLKIFGNKLKIFDDSKIGNCTVQIHLSKKFLNSIIFKRNKLFKDKIRNFEKNNKIKYDCIITMRPDLYIDDFKFDLDRLEKSIKASGNNAFFFENLKNMIKNCVTNNKSYVGKCRTLGIGGPRLDHFFLSKKFFSEIIENKFKDNNLLSKQKCTERFVIDNFDFIILSNCIKFYTKLYLLKIYENKINFEKFVNDANDKINLLKLN